MLAYSIRYTNVNESSNPIRRCFFSNFLVRVYSSSPLMKPPSHKGDTILGLWRWASWRTDLWRGDSLIKGEPLWLSLNKVCTLYNHQKTIHGLQSLLCYRCLDLYSGNFFVSILFTVTKFLLIKCITTNRDS